MTMIKTIESNNHRISLMGDGIVRVYSRGDVTENCIIDVFEKIAEIADGESINTNRSN